MHITLNSDLRKAGPADARQLADITADAFAEDPVMRWMLGSPRAIQSTFRVLAREMYVPSGLCYLHGNSGAAMWMPPGQAASPSVLGKLKLAIGLMFHGSKGAMDRALEAGATMEKHHPKEPHMYLFTIGSTQAARGKGIGKALLAPVLEACDRESVPVYLENSNPANTGFYGAHGFVPVGEFFPGEGSPAMMPMWREPKTAGA